MESLIRKSLKHCGYDYEEPTEESLIECFLDHVDCGSFGNLDYDEAENLIEEGEITTEQMCYNLLKLR